MGAANIASQFYQGQPFQMPGLMQYMPGQGGLGMGGGGMGGGGIANPATMPGIVRERLGPNVRRQMPGRQITPGMLRAPQIPFPGMPNPMGGAPWMTPGQRIPT